MCCSTISFGCRSQQKHNMLTTGVLKGWKRNQIGTLLATSAVEDQISLPLKPVLFSVLSYWTKYCGILGFPRLHDTKSHIICPWALGSLSCKRFQMSAGAVHLNQGIRSKRSHRALWIPCAVGTPPWGFIQCQGLQRPLAELCPNWSPTKLWGIKEMVVVLISKMCAFKKH